MDYRDPLSEVAAQHQDTRFRELVTVLQLRVQKAEAMWSGGELFRSSEGPETASDTDLTEFHFRIGGASIRVTTQRTKPVLSSNQSSSQN